ncbi:hypothetical protein CR513_16793, partial [Mucuna pruriens]
MIVKRSIPEAFRSSIFESQNKRKFLEKIEQFFVKNEKVKTSNLLAKLISMKYKGKGNITKYIMEISNIAAKLKSLKLELDEDLIMHLVEMSNLLAKHIYMKYKSKGNIREYIIKMTNLVAKLKSLKLELSEDLIMH